ncbi:hypothetical protein MCHIJ_14940 [Mycolicibacterium chitae]|uniref:Uncharacterized protein n=1 Tax=Mycolicibacterium chitae TaxID=1792 RepID=A0A3S4SDP4_MYCCI|nr:hypothetical protein [Mycolicibacterium chitae]MCV7107776.1 hypothetical protein [Mycolicibacterium chitae]BBZ02057.1 hypothetical protein MCHIJ_14940 [Mycolicibacterium chitae]VEG50874.1 Uncharacterised protein [Mycolicibacterium chitae]
MQFRFRTAIPATVIAVGLGPAFAAVAAADEAPAAPGGGPAVIACQQFAQALDYAATNYSDFADSVAFGDARLDFADPTVRSNNTVGRTALRQAAGVALDAAGTPGLQPQIADPMRSWSLHATKLLLLMGVRSGSERIDNAAAQVNTDTHDVQMACAQAGTSA